MVLIIGAMGAIAWALIVAWIARLAQDRGRFVPGWALGAGAAGVIGCAAGFAFMEHTALPMVSIWIPVVSLVVPMIAIGLVLRREPIKVSHRDEWPVHFVAHGPGRVSIDAGAVHFVWADGSCDATFDQLRGVAIDGECVRITYAVGHDERELAVLPMGKPATPAGRRQQSQALLLRLRANRGAATWRASDT